MFFQVRFEKEEFETIDCIKFISFPNLLKKAGWFNNPARGLARYNKLNGTFDTMGGGTDNDMFAFAKVGNDFYAGKNDQNSEI